MTTIGRHTWSQEQDSCWVCGKPEEIGRFMETHEIARGVHRSKAIVEPCCWMRVCSKCHDTLGSMTIAQQLAMKWIHDAKNYDRVKVNRICRRADNAVTAEEVTAEVEKLR